MSKRTPIFSIDSAPTGASAQATPHLPTMLSDIRIDFGPADVLGRYFLLADYALQELGISLSFGTFADLLDTNRANRDTWRPLLATFDPANGLMDPAQSYAMIGRNLQGQVVTVHGVRIFEWQSTDFETEAQNLRMFFNDPAAKALNGETCRVTAPSAARLTGRVAFSGAAWRHPSVRGQLIGAVIARASRAYSLTRWNTDMTAAAMSKTLIEKGFGRQNGYRHTEVGFELKNFELGYYDGALVWITADEIIADIVAFSAELETRLESFARLRRA